MTQATDHSNEAGSESQGFSLNKPGQLPQLVDSRRIRDRLCVSLSTARKLMAQFEAANAGNMVILAERKKVPEAVFWLWLQEQKLQKVSV